MGDKMKFASKCVLREKAEEKQYSNALLVAENLDDAICLDWLETFLGSLPGIAVEKYRGDGNEQGLGIRYPRKE